MRYFILWCNRYYDQLYKEFAIVDLSKYKESQFGLRWRTEVEVVEGKGQYICGGKNCRERSDLSIYELPFRYKENNIVKDELLKVKVCIDCGKKLTYKSKKRSHKDKDKEEKVPKKKK